MFAEEILFAPIWPMCIGTLVYVIHLFTPISVYRMGIISSVILFLLGVCLFINHMRQKYLQCEKEKTVVMFDKNDFFSFHLVHYYICVHLITLLTEHTIVQSTIYAINFIISFF